MISLRIEIMILTTSEENSKNLANRSKNSDNGNSKANSSNHLSKLRPEKLMNGELESIDLKKKSLEVNSYNFIRNNL